MPTDELQPASAPLSEGGAGRRDLGVGVASAAFGLLLLVAVIPTQIGPIGSEKTILAILGAVGLIVFGLILAATNLRAAREPAPAHPLPDAESDAGGRFEAFATLAVIVVYAFALDWLGYVLASYLCLAALTGVMGVRSPVRLAILPALIVAAVYFGIDVALGSHLPEGEIEWGALLGGDDAQEGN